MNKAIIEIAVPGSVAAYFFPKLIRKLKKN